MAKLRVGVIGAGGIGFGVHLPGYARLKDVELVAVCDIEEAKLQRAVEKYQVPNTFTDYNEMLKMKDLDAVTIATPNYLHAPVAIAALNAGKHVLCEKPLSIKAEYAQQMVDAANKAGKLFMIGVNRRYEERSQQLKKMIQSGELGKVYAANTGWLRRRGVPYWGGWFMEKAKSGGGPLIDLGVHMLDLTWWLLGTPKPISVTGSTYHEIENFTITEWDINDPVLIGAMAVDTKNIVYDIEDSAFALIKFEGGITITLAASWALNTEREITFLDLYGSKGGARWNPLTIYTEKDNNLANLEIKTQERHSHFVEIEHFVDCVRNGKEPLSPAREAVEIMKILDAIYKSAETGSEIKL